MKRADIQVIRDMLNIQGYDGNWNYNDYMTGMYNGIECVLATLELRDPVYRECLTRKEKFKKWSKKTFYKLMNGGETKVMESK